MQYAQQSDITAMYGSSQLLMVSDRDNDGVSDAGVADTALVNASAEIDTYLSNKYTLPLADIPQILIIRCVDIAIYLMAVPTPNVLTDAIKTRYEAAMTWLRAVRDGTANLGTPQTQTGEDLPATQKNCTNVTGGRGGSFGAGGLDFP